MILDTTTKEGMLKRTIQLVNDYAERHNWVAIGNLIGGSPRYDLQDITPADESSSHPDDL